MLILIFMTAVALLHANAFAENKFQNSNLENQAREFVRLTKLPNPVLETLRCAKILHDTLQHEDCRNVGLEEWLAVNRALEHFFSHDLTLPQRSVCQILLKDINKPIFMYTTEQSGFGFTHEVQPGETLSSIARQGKIYPDRIIRINRISNPNALNIGQPLRIIPGRVKLVVVLRGFYINAYINEVLFKHYPVAISKKGNTPKTTTRVSSSLARNPDYTDDRGIITRGDNPDNPVGTRWIGLELGRGFGIHGTSQPSSIGKAESKGCIRMLNADVEELFDFVMVGDVVQIL